MYIYIYINMYMSGSICLLQFNRLYPMWGIHASLGTACPTETKQKNMKIIYSFVANWVLTTSSRSHLV